MPSASKLRRADARAEKFGHGKSKAFVVNEAGLIGPDTALGDLDVAKNASEAESDESDEVPTTKSYGSLLASFATNGRGQHVRKRRKLNDDEARDVLSERAVNGESSHNVVNGTKNLNEDIRSKPIANAPPEIEHDSIDPFAVQDEEKPDDPFEVHFASPDSEDLQKRTEAVKQRKWTRDNQQTTSLSSSSSYVLLRELPGGSKYIESTKQVNVKSIDELRLKKRLLQSASAYMSKIDETQSKLASTIFNYEDLLFARRTVQNAKSLRDVTCLHILNHIFKTRDRILKNTTRLSREEHDPDLELRDQGFTRPKVLILLETRQAVVRYMNAITALCGAEQQENRQRFHGAFDNADDSLPDSKPDDFRELFDGNNDNDFRLGVKFTRKTVKYYSQFYSSDIIFASPLGLRRAMKADDAKHMDHDLLSSIEMLIIDQADAMLMQNWEHVEYVIEHLNLQPKEPHGCDFSRVRNWYLDGKARFLRQSIVFSAYETPELVKLYSQDMLNVTGKVRVRSLYEGVIQNINLSISQTFHRYHALEITSVPDANFNAFTATILPSITRLSNVTPEGDSLGLLLFIPSYFDFTRLRNFFQSSPVVQNIPWGAISENDPLPLVKRARSHFLSGRYSVLLYTGRAHHFRRYRIKGVKRVFFYGIPENPTFYSEIVGDFLRMTAQEGRFDEKEMLVKCLFSKWDSLSLERIVGSKRVRKMLSEKGMGDTFEFT